MGTDRSNTLFSWLEMLPGGNWQIPANISPASSGLIVDTLNAFFYTPSLADLEADSIALRLYVTPPVCPAIHAEITLYVDLNNPDGIIQLIEQPEGAQEPCEELYYTVKITENGLGGLANLNVSMNDVFGTIISVVRAEYFYAENGWGELNMDDPAQLATLEWEEVDMDKSVSFVFGAMLPDTLILEQRDSLLVRFTAIAECGFYAGNNYRFDLQATSVCNSPMYTKSVSSDIFKLNFENKELPEFWLYSKLNHDTISNNIPMQRTVTWTVEWAYIPETGEVERDKQTVYFNIPAGMALQSIKSLDFDLCDYNYNVDEHPWINNCVDDVVEPGFETCYDDPTTKEYQLPLPDLDYENWNILDTVKFEITFTIDPEVSCETFQLYMEIVHEDYLTCATTGENCLFGFIKVGSYPELTVELYDFDVQFDDNVSTYRGTMHEEGTFWSGVFRVQTLTDLNAGHEIELVFYNDTNNNGIIDGDEVGMAPILYEIDRDYAAGEYLVINLNETLIPTEDHIQLLVSLGGDLVCEGLVIPLVTFFGQQKICQGEEVAFHTVSGMTGYQFSITSKSGVVPTPTTHYDEVQYHFTSVDTFMVSARYVPAADMPYSGRYLNWTSMEVVVYPYPELALAGDKETVICLGAQVELSQFFEVTTNTESIIYIYKKETESESTLIGSTEDGNTVLVTPWETSTYTAVAVNAAGCESNIVAFDVIVTPTLQVWANVETQPTCTEKGSIAVNISGGSGTYLFSVDGTNFEPLQNNIIHNLDAGTYIIYVKDVHTPVCQISYSEPVTLTPNSGLYATSQVTNASGCGAPNGVIKLWADLGTPPYQYATNGVDYLNMPLDSIVNTNFAPGTYTFYVKDATQCTAATTATVTAGEDAIAFELTTRDAICAKEGMLMLDISGTNTPYSYRFTGGGWTELLATKDSLPIGAGTHTLYLQDATGCTVSKTIEIGTASTLSAAIDTIFNVVCEGTHLGSITLSITGGRPAYHYTVNAGYRQGTGNVPSFTIYGLQTGTYQILVQDADGCTLTLDGIHIGKENEVMQLVVEKEITICEDQSVYLPDMIIYTEHTDTVIFYTDKNFTTPVSSLTVNTTGWRYVSAYNKYLCYETDSIFVNVLPRAVPNTISANNIKICTTADAVELSASAPTVVNPVYRWYESQTATSILSDEATLTVEIPSVTTNTVLHYYVSVEGDNFCANTVNHRREVTVTVYPVPELTISTETPNLCAAATFRADVHYNIGTDLTDATYRWYHYDPASDSYTNMPSAPVMQPNASGNVLGMSSQFAYTLQAGVDTEATVQVRLTMTTPVCGAVSSDLTVYLESGDPDGELELIWQPVDPQQPCATVHYILKVSEAGDGGLANINVIMSDWFGSLLGITKVEYYHNEDWADVSDINELNALDWVEADWDEPAAYVISARFPDIKLENNDSLLVRFTAITECGFYAGNNYHFTLNGTDICDETGGGGATQMEEKFVISDPLQLDFDVELPEFWLESTLSTYHINNNIPLEREITWTVAWGYLGGGEVDIDLQTIYFNVPTGMSLLSIKSIGDPRFHYLNEDVTVDDCFLNCYEDVACGWETCFDDPSTKEYQIPLFDMDYSTFNPETDTIRFEVTFRIDAGVACQTFPLYMEIIHEDSLYCPTAGMKCLFGFIKVGDYHDLEIALYDFDMLVEHTTNTPYQGEMHEDGALWGGAFRLVTNTNLYYDPVEPHTFDITFFADMNNNGVLDDDEIENYEMGALVYTIEEEHEADDIIEIQVLSPYIPTEDGKQLLARLGGEHVCAMDAYPLITLFGTQTICEGDTHVYYTADGMRYYDFSPSVAGMTRIPLEGETQIHYLDDHAARYHFTTPGVYEIHTSYQLPGVGLLSPAYITVTVTQRPVLGFTANADTTICRGSQIELSHFFKETTGVASTIEFYEIKNNNPVLTGDNSSGNPLFIAPWETTTYRAIAYNESGCYAYSSLEFTVYVNTMPQAFATVMTHPTCEGDKGTIQLTVTGGSGTYTYSLDGISTPQPLLPNAEGKFLISNLAQGNYTIYVYDANNMVCSPVTTEPPVILAPPSGLSATATATDASACGSATGTVVLTAMNGTPPYQYFIEGRTPAYTNIPANGNIGNNFASGTYPILVSDATGCITTTNAVVSVTEGAGIQLILTQETPANCNLEGVLSIKLSGGAAPYAYRMAASGWMGMNSDSTALPVGAGSHTIYVQDSEGCSTYGNVTIHNETNLFAEIDTIITVKCEGEHLGSITFTVSNAALPFTYNLNSGFIENVSNQNTVTIFNLQAGAYQMMITDNNHCEYDIDRIVIETDRDMPVIVKTGINACLGSEVNLRNLILPASQSIDTVLFYTDLNFTEELYPPVVNTPGIYYVSAFNAIGCFVNDSIEVTMYATPALSITPNSWTRCGAPAGNFVLTPHIQTGSNIDIPVSYNWQWINPETGVPQNPNDENGAGLLPNYSGGATIPASFIYYPTGTADTAYVQLQMNILTNYCGTVSENITLYTKIYEPNAYIELLTQPVGPQKLCTDTMYVLKITETLTGGGLTNIKVTLNDYLSSYILVDTVEYLYPVHEATPWRPMELIRDNKIFYASIPEEDNILLEQGDTLLVRFKVNTDCDFLGGLPVEFLLDGYEACKTVPLSTKSTGDTRAYKLHWGDEEVAEYRITGTLTPDLISNGPGATRKVTLTVEYEWVQDNGALPNFDGSEMVSLNIPFPTPIYPGIVQGAVSSTDGTGFYDTIVPEYIFYPNETLKEYHLPLNPAILNGETITFEIELTIEDTITCGDFEYYIEIIKQGELTCGDDPEPCDVLEIMDGSYPVLTVDLYSFELVFVENSQDYFNVMNHGERSG
jgi:hypothetical protein